MATSDFQTNQSSAEAFHRAFESGLTHERKRLGQTHSLYINGQPCRSKAPTFATACPADARILMGRFQQAAPDHVAKAVNAARRAFPFWRELGWEPRLSFVRKMGELLGKHRHEFAALLSLEAGHNRYEAAEEVRHAQEVIDYYCRQMELHQGYRHALGSQGSERTFNILEPYGVWAVVSPFCSPLSTAANMISAALIAGNTVVYKPSSKTPCIGLRICELVQQAGSPIGIVNCLTGSGASMGGPLAEHPGIDGLIFTGTRRAGQLLHQKFSVAFHKPCIMEMGGNNPVIVMPTAPLREAAEGVARSAFGMSGQRSSSCSRVYVHRQVAGEFMEILTELAAACRVGDPTARDTVMGPLIDEAAVKSFQKAVRLARRDGRLVRGGQTLKKGEHAHGHFVEPTIVDRVKTNSALFTKEILAPVLSVTEIKSLQEAVTLCNASPYGLAAGIFTQIDGEQEEFFDTIQAGVAVCNRRHDATAISHPGEQSFGGWKASGNTGRNASGPYYLTQFMREQCRTVCW